MILILSESSDSSSDKVCSWLNYYKKKYIRLNRALSQNCIQNVYFDGSEVKVEIKLGNQLIDLSKISVFWCRRGKFRHTINPIITDNIELDKVLIEHHLTELRRLTEFTHTFLEESSCINNPKLYNVNKLNLLRQAQKCGLKIPKTLISRRPERVVQHFAGEDFITKNISEIFFHKDDSYIYSQSTIQVDSEELGLRNKMSPSLFQKFIGKKYELRIFFLADMFFSSAIFSGNNDKTREDFRNYDTKNENRLVPFKLPAKIKESLIMLSQLTGINSGSVDMIVDYQDDYYFIEINPVGQFEWVSRLCNFGIEQEIAKYLIEKSNEKIKTR
jgi:ATP-GRASP peptide maturase of grasp-with-spasm system